jgi:hypothetical protein
VKSKTSILSQIVIFVKLKRMPWGGHPLYQQSTIIIYTGARVPAKIIQARIDFETRLSTIYIRSPNK